MENRLGQPPPLRRCAASLRLADSPALRRAAAQPSPSIASSDAKHTDKSFSGLDQLLPQSIFSLSP